MTGTTFTLAATTGVATFAANHGLSLQDSPLGEASLAGAAAFLPALIGAVSLLVALIVMLMAGPGREPA